MLSRPALRTLSKGKLPVQSPRPVTRYQNSTLHSISASRLPASHHAPSRVTDTTHPNILLFSVPRPTHSIPSQTRSLHSTGVWAITDPKTGRGEPKDPAGPGSGASKEDAAQQNGDYSVNQPEFESTASSQAGKDPYVERAAGVDELPSDKQDAPRGPIPDLRQGIPSTFEQEFAPSDKSSSFKDKDAPEPALNVTEDPTKEDARDEQGELPKQAYVSSIERRRNRLANIAYLTALLLVVGLAASMGGEWESEEEARKFPDAPNGWSPSAIYSRISARLAHQLGYYTEPVFTKILPDVSLDQRPPYTLVMSLQDLLITSKWSMEHGWQVAKRPGFDYFIRYLLSYYELVVYTSVPSMNGQMVMLKLDPYHLITYYLFREHTRYMNGEHVKDLSCLNRDPSKIIVIDTSEEHVKLQPENAIVLPKWSGKPDDERTGDLAALVPFLEYVAIQPNADVRKILKSYEGKHIPTEFARREQQLRAEQEKRSKRQQRSAGGISNMLGFSAGATGSPQMQERIKQNARQAYEDLEKEIRENGAKWLEQQKELDKQQMEEMTKTVQSNPMAYFSMMLGGGPKPGDDGNKPK